MVSLLLASRQTSLLISKEARPVYIPANNAGGFPSFFLTLLTILIVMSDVSAIITGVK